MSFCILDNLNSVPNGKTRFCFLFGSTLEFSASPELHSAWFAKHRFNAVYLPFEIESKDYFMHFAKLIIETKGFIGGNITMPFKKIVLDLDCFFHDESVVQTGAANTIYKKDNKNWCLANTDIFGINKSFQKLICKTEPFVAIVLGGGGAAQAALHCLKMDVRCQKAYCFSRSLCGNDLQIFLNDEEKSIKYFHLMDSGLLEADIKKIAKDKKIIVVNTLPLGKKDEENNTYALNWLMALRAKNLAFFDMRYELTDAQECAQKLGIPFIDGQVMLENQAKESFRLWTGVSP